MDTNEPAFLVKQARLLSLLLFVEEARDALIRADALLPPRGPLRERADAERKRVDRILARWHREGASHAPWRVQPHTLVKDAP
jgi:tetraacyldisaccharide-1-P 4'-kinase